MNLNPFAAKKLSTPMKIAFFGLKEPEKKDYFSKALSGQTLSFIDDDLNDNSLPEQSDFDIISIFVQSEVSAKVIDHFPNLKMIAIRSTGFDNVDCKYAKTKNVIVCNVPAYGSHTVAEFTFGLILSLSRNIPEASERVKSKVEFNHDGLKGFDLFGKVLGVIGTGKIGANVIKIAKGFGMIVLACDAYPNKELAKTFEFQYVPLERLLKESDIVTIHVPSLASTKHMINKSNITLMKPGSVLINTARGDVVETEALYSAIQTGHLGGAGLDVIEDEKELSKDMMKEEFEPSMIKNLLEDSSIIKNPNVIVTPHTAFYTVEAEQAISQTTLENIQAFQSGSPKNIVN